MAAIAARHHPEQVPRVGANRGAGRAGVGVRGAVGEGRAGRPAAVSPEDERRRYVVAGDDPGVDRRPVRDRITAAAGGGGEDGRRGADRWSRLRRGSENVTGPGDDARMTTLGAIFVPQNPPESLRRIAEAADDAGLEELWLWEDCFLNGGISAAAAALAWTANLRVGVGITPVPFRNVAVQAMEIATLRRMFGERAIIGIGHGVQEWMGQVGARPESPMTLLREYASALRALLNGETVTTKGRYVHLDAVK